jgi:hypothetical protein
MAVWIFAASSTAAPPATSESPTTSAVPSTSVVPATSGVPKPSRVPIPVIDPPGSPYTPPPSVTNEIMTWLGYVMYTALAISVISVMIFATMIILDRDRTEPVSGSAPYVTAIRIALGVMIISAAGSLAAYFA